MLNRRLLRIKIFQALYSYYQTDSDNIEVALKNLFTSFRKMHELFIRNLFIIVKIADTIDDRHETGKQKFIRSDESESLKRLSENIAIAHFKTNTDYQHLIGSYKINISGFEDIVKIIARNIEESKEYTEFRNSTNKNNDSGFLRLIYKNYIYTDPHLMSVLEEMNIHWANDQYYMGIALMSYLKKDSFFNSENQSLPGVFKPVELEDAESDEEFVKLLFTKTILNRNEYEERISQYLENWEPDRIALTDMIIMRMACAEIIQFNQIPVKVSLNEYIELTKIFSTPKSKIFVNGVLDKVISHFQREGRFEKIGRGLQDNS